MVALVAVVALVALMAPLALMTLVAPMNLVALVSLVALVALVAMMALVAMIALLPPQIPPFAGEHPLDPIRSQSNEWFPFRFPSSSIIVTEQQVGPLLATVKSACYFPRNDYVSLGEMITFETVSLLWLQNESPLEFLARYSQSKKLT